MIFVVVKLECNAPAPQTQGSISPTSISQAAQSLGWVKFSRRSRSETEDILGEGFVRGANYAALTVSFRVTKTKSWQSKNDGSIGRWICALSKLSQLFLHTTRLGPSPDGATRRVAGRMGRRAISVVEADTTARIQLACSIYSHSFIRLFVCVESALDNV